MNHNRFRRLKNFLNGLLGQMLSEAMAQGKRLRTENEHILQTLSRNKLKLTTVEAGRATLEPEKPFRPKPPLAPPPAAVVTRKADPKSGARAFDAIAPVDGFAPPYLPAVSAPSFKAEGVALVSGCGAKSAGLETHNPFGALVPVDGVATPSPLGVSAPNFKAEGAALVSGGGAKSTGVETHNAVGGYGAGSFAFPIGARWGASLDSVIGTAEGSPFVGAAAHLFWRNPAVGLVGVYGSLGSVDRQATPMSSVDTTYTKLGLGAQFYFKRFTVEGLAGWETGGPVNNANFTYGAAGLRNRFSTKPISPITLSMIGA